MIGSSAFYVRLLPTTNTNCRRDYSPSIDDSSPDVVFLLASNQVGKLSWVSFVVCFLLV